MKANPVGGRDLDSVNLAILAFCCSWWAMQYIADVMKPNASLTMSTSATYKAPKMDEAAGGGGGGGDHRPRRSDKGKLPKHEGPDYASDGADSGEAEDALTPAIDVQKDIKLPDNPDMPNIGMKNSANVTLARMARAAAAAWAPATAAALGSGNGQWIRAGHRRQYRRRRLPDRRRRFGAGADLTPEAEFSDEARRAKYQGVCLISLIVDAQGNPQNPHVVRPLGMGLDEKALEAVRKYKFKPAMKDGKTPVPVMITIEVNFRLY